MARHGENIYKRKDGRYEGRYVKGRRSDGKTVFGYIYGRRYQDVRNRLLSIKAKQMENRGYRSCTLTLGEWMARWLEGEKRVSVKFSSYQTYLRSYRIHILPELGSLLLSSIGTDELQAFITHLREKGCAEGTVCSVYRLLSSAMKRAQEEGMIVRNPCKAFRLPGECRTEQRVLSRKEQEMVSGAVSAKGDLAALLGLYAGMRIGEICALKWTDIRWEDHAIVVRRTVQRVTCRNENGRRTMLMIGTPKSMRACRAIPLPDFVMELLRTLAKKSRSEYVLGKACSPAEPRTIQRRFERVMRQLGLGGVHFHTLRHSYATRLLELGVDIKTVSALLGHSSAKLTLDFYGHSLLDQQRIAVSKLAALSF